LPLISQLSPNSRHGLEGEFLSGYGDATKSHEVPIAMTFAAHVRRAITTLLFLWVAGCSEEPPAPNVEFLASDAHFLVAGHHIVVPIAAIRTGAGFHDRTQTVQQPRQGLEDEGG
jgi:hypothetical protein